MGRTFAFWSPKSNTPRALYFFSNLTLRSGVTIPPRLRNALVAFFTRLNASFDSEQLKGQRWLLHRGTNLTTLTSAAGSDRPG